ncbi:sensor histidine kinase [Paraburkholderia caribensis]|uniref:sensor histidine kinase n=1 Tax=Paraburkholderia caribensis TaxID=75105 RepID=UPI00398BB4AA
MIAAPAEEGLERRSAYTPRALPTLFDPLTRAAPSQHHKPITPGMGLGLYICRCIAHAHHGTIAVESDERGTVFTVDLPRGTMPNDAGTDSS